MERLFVSLATMIAVASLLMAGCTPAAPAPTPAPTKAPAAPTTAPAAPTKAPAAPAKAAEATKAPEPTKAQAAQPTAAPAKKMDYPGAGKTVTMIVPYPAGGTSDLHVRLLVSYMEKDLMASIPVVNRVGAATQVGMTELSKSRPDGYTLGATHLPTMLGSYLDPDRGAVYTRQSFQPVAVLSSDPMVIGVKTDSPHRTMKDLVDAAKASPEKVSICGPGIGSTPHLALLALQKVAGVRFAIVQSEGDPQCIASVMGGHVNVATGSPASFLSSFKSGEMRGLAVTGPEEIKFLPGLKPFQAQGYNVSLVNSRGVSAPAGTPMEIVDILTASIKRVMEIGEFQKKLEELAVGAKYMTPAQYAAHWIEMENLVKPLLEELKAAEKK